MPHKSILNGVIMTNGDYIRNSTDEELSMILSTMVIDILQTIGCNTDLVSSDSLFDSYLEYLESEYVNEGMLL